MATDVKCMTHSDKPASGYCSRCQMPYCADCLDVEMGQPLCKVCKSKFAPAASASAGGSPLNFKGKGLDDDPLGLFGGGPASAPAPKLEPPKAPAPKLELPKVMPTFSDMKAAQNPTGSTTATPSLTAGPSSAPTTSPKSPMDLDSLMNEPQAPRPPFPKAPSLGAPPPLSAGISSPFSTDSMQDMAASTPKKNKFISLTKVWTKYLIRRSYEMFDPLARKLRVPTYVFLVLLAAILFGAIVGVGTILNRPSVAMAETIPPIHIIKVNAAQVSEMDVTAYADLQNQLQTMGFTPSIQMTVPQLPSPNFFDVGIKENVGIYSEILKIPGQITPHLSFVTVFTNGVWFSTNGWQGDNQTMEYLISEFYPKDTPDQLYVKHFQAVEKLTKEKDWQPQSMNENRYVAALSDHLRWFLVKKDIQGFKADFAMWH